MHLILHKSKLFNHFGVSGYNDMPTFAFKKIEIAEKDLTTDYLEVCAADLYYNKKIFAYLENDKEVKKIKFEESNLKVALLKLNELKPYLEQKFMADLQVNSFSSSSNSKLPLLYNKELGKIWGYESLSMASKKATSLSKKGFLKKREVLINLHTENKSVKRYNKKAICVYGDLYEQEGNYISFNQKRLYEVHPFISIFHKIMGQSLPTKPKQISKEEAKKFLKYLSRTQKKPEYLKSMRETYVDKNTGQTLVEVFYKKQRKYKNRKAKTSSFDFKVKISNLSKTVENCVRVISERTNALYFSVEERDVQGTVLSNLIFGLEVRKSIQVLSPNISTENVLDYLYKSKALLNK